MVDLKFIELPAYTALVMLGIVLGLFAAFLFWRAYSRRADVSQSLDGALVALIAGWLGARAYHVVTHWDYYSLRPDEIVRIGLGGLAMRGALIAGAIALALYARVRGWRFARLADTAAIGLCVGQAVGWMGALRHGANYGIVSDSQIAIDLPDIYGLYAPRFPLQHAEIILFVGLFIVLLLAATRHPRAGTLFAAYLLFASTANFLLGFHRGDEAAFVGGLRIDQWSDVALVASALVFWLLGRREGKVGIN